MGRSGSGSCPFVGFDVNGVEPLHSAAALLDMRLPFYFFFCKTYATHVWGCT
jgi:hypothetical protein